MVDVMIRTVMFGISRLMPTPFGCMLNTHILIFVYMNVKWSTRNKITKLRKTPTRSMRKYCSSIAKYQNISSSRVSRNRDD